MNLPIDITVQSSGTIRDALGCINRNSLGIVFVTEGRRLLGVATDGDLRRALLGPNTVDSPITNAMNRNFVALPVTSDNNLIRKTFSKALRIIPLIDASGNLVDVADQRRSHRIPVLEPQLAGREFEYLSDCVATNWISSKGAYVGRFEELFEALHPNSHALSVSNGTVALHLALHTLGIGDGDEVIVPNITFAATANAVFYCGARPVLVEISADSLCMDTDEVEKLITPRTKAIIPVHLYGQPANMAEVGRLADRYNLLVIEDCAEAIGSRINDQIVGTFGDAATFSFFGNKTISTGEGGMILFKKSADYDRAKILRDHGMDPSRRYWHNEIGFNYRLTNLQSAVGVAQMERFETILEKKIRIFKRYREGLKECAGISYLPRQAKGEIHSNWLFTIVLVEGTSRDTICTNLLEAGIETRPVFFPLSEMPPYRHCTRSPGLSTSNFVSRQGLSFPSSLTLTDADQDFIIETFLGLMADANS